LNSAHTQTDVPHLHLHSDHHHEGVSSSHLVPCLDHHLHTRKRLNRHKPEIDANRSVGLGWAVARTFSMVPVIGATAPPWAPAPLTAARCLGTGTDTAALPSYTHNDHKNTCTSKHRTEVQDKWPPEPPRLEGVPRGHQTAFEA